MHACTHSFGQWDGSDTYPNSLLGKVGSQTIEALSISKRRANKDELRLLMLKEEWIHTVISAS